MLRSSAICCKTPKLGYFCAIIVHIVPVRTKSLDATGAEEATFRDGIRDETWLFGSQGFCSGASVDVEVDVYIHVYLDRFAVLHRGFELVLADGFDSFLIQPHAYTSSNLDV